MQIHELNNYNGNLESSAYLAVDNGSDTGKISTTELLADTNAAVSQLDTVLNGRIDNIVAGGEAPSASEIVDARYGADGVTYPSLGAAIRDQVTDLKSDLGNIEVSWISGKVILSDGTPNGSNDSYSLTEPIYVYGNSLYVKTRISNAETWLAVAFYDENNAFVSGISNNGGSSYTFERTIEIPANARTVRMCCVTDDIENRFLYANYNLKSIVKDRIVPLEERTKILEADKVDKVDGKGLSTNDFTNEEKAIVKNVETQIHNIKTNKSSFSWELGAITSLGTKITSDKKCRTDFIFLKKGTQIWVNEGFMYRVYRYSSNNELSFIDYYGYSADSTLHYARGRYRIPSDDYYIIVVSKVDDSSIEDATTVGNNINVSEMLCVNDLRKSVSIDVMPYNKSGIDNYINDINSLAGDLVIHLITDIHGDDTDTYPLMNYLANAGCGNAFICLGDVIKSTYPTRLDAINFMTSAYRRAEYSKTNTPFIFVQGNHDTNPAPGIDTNKNITQSIFYALSKARTRDVKQNVNKAYGYKDIEKCKVRIIYINTSDIFDADGNALVSGANTMIQQEQFRWFANVALDFTDKDIPTDWSVIIASHDSLSQISSEIFSAILNAFTSGTSVNATYSITVSDYKYDVTVNHDYTEQGAIPVICEVNGHHHTDMIRELSTTGIKQIYIACDGMSGSASYKDSNNAIQYYTRTLGTVTEHIIDTMILDKSSRTVTFKRFGVGADRQISY